jgi:hypothetical protein
LFAPMKSKFKCIHTIPPPPLCMWFACLS